MFGHHLWRIRERERERQSRNLIRRTIWGARQKKRIISHTCREYRTETHLPIYTDKMRRMSVDWRLVCLNVRSVDNLFCNLSYNISQNDSETTTLNNVWTMNSKSRDNGFSNGKQRCWFWKRKIMNLRIEIYLCKIISKIHKEKLANIIKLVSHRCIEPEKPLVWQNFARLTLFQHQFELQIFLSIPPIGTRNLSSTHPTPHDFRCASFLWQLRMVKWEKMRLLPFHM